MSLAKIGVLTLYLRPGADRLFSEKVLASLKQGMPDLETEVISDAPHLVQQRRPEESAAAIMRWAHGPRPLPDGHEILATASSVSRAERPLHRKTLGVTLGWCEIFIP